MPGMINSIKKLNFPNIPETEFIKEIDNKIFKEVN